MVGAEYKMLLALSMRCVERVDFRPAELPEKISNAALNAARGALDPRSPSRLFLSITPCGAGKPCWRTLRGAGSCGCGSSRETPARDSHVACPTFRRNCPGGHHCFVGAVRMAAKG